MPEAIRNEKDFQFLINFLLIFSFERFSFIWKSWRAAKTFQQTILEKKSSGKFSFLDLIQIIIWNFQFSLKIQIKEMLRLKWKVYAINFMLTFIDLQIFLKQEKHFHTIMLQGTISDDIWIFPFECELLSNAKKVIYDEILHETEKL